MLQKFKGIIAILKTNYRLYFSCLILVVLSSVVYFFLTNAPRAQLSDCTSSLTLNTQYPANNCNPVLCSDLSDVEARGPDSAVGYNCFYARNNLTNELLRPCKAFSGGASGSVPVSGAKPRENCADIIDLPLCSIFNPPTTPSIRPGINCVKESSEISETGTAGVNFGIHNKDSVCFCGSEGNNCDTYTSCKQISCHQMTASQTPNGGSNCTHLTCDILTPTELKVSDNRFDNGEKKYCDGSNKCYNFFHNTPANPDNSKNLVHVKYRNANSMCVIHDCPPVDSSCGANDLENIPSDTQYRNNYKEFINNNIDLSAGFCKRMLCNPISYRQYACTNVNDEFQPDSKCDTDLECPGGYCTKKIDCNLSVNQNEEECEATATSVDNTPDSRNSWFYLPTPSPKVLDSSGYINTKIANAIKDDSCYSVSEMKSLGWGWEFWGVWWHLLGGGDVDHRSPGACDGGNNAWRARGYRSICDGGEAAYIKGFARAKYSGVQYPTYEITSCVRYRNAFDYSACGKRSCRIDASSGWGLTSVSNWCGFDECHTVQVTEEDIDRCSMKNDDIFKNVENPSGVKCLGDKMDSISSVRVRARKYGGYVCAYVDHLDIFSDNTNFNGDETVQVGNLVKCVDGEFIDDPNNPGQKICNGRNTDSDNGERRWRTGRRIQYIGNVFGGNASQKGFVDMDGKFHSMQDCAKVPLRIGPPRFYQVATAANSSHLFEPPVYIVNARVKRDGAVSDPILGETIGRTDIFEPEIEVGFGLTRQKMSLGAGYIGDDSNPESYPSSPWTKIISSSEGPSGSYEADLFIKKEYDELTNLPTLCLYRRFSDTNGIPLTPIKVMCVIRGKPEISDLDSEGKIRMRISLKSDASNTYNSAKMKFNMIYDFGVNNQNNNCTNDDSCSNEFIFENTVAGIENCTNDVENHKVCSRRDECSRLVSECAINEVNLHNAAAANLPTGQYESIKADCNSTLLAKCNLNFGIIQNDAPDFFSQIDNTNQALIDSNYNNNYQNFQSLFTPETKSKITVPNRYGWFHEICLTRGFEDKLKNIIAYKTTNGIMGKCLINPNQSQAINCASGSGYNSCVQTQLEQKCGAGGKAPNCVCQENVDGSQIDSQVFEIRKETPREAGLCIDIPLPKFCQAIDYTPVDPSDSVADPDYVNSSITHSTSNNIYSAGINNSNYNNNNGIHTSHKTRSDASDYNHAEYNSFLEGMNDIYGECKGFWSNQFNGGNMLRPILHCGAGGVWQRPENSNPCVLNSCPDVTTTGPIKDAAVNNFYQNDYALNEVDDEMGRKHGYAVWSSYKKTNDFLQDSTATSCITGYKTSAAGLPVRYCKQNGIWEEGTSVKPIRNQCERIMCPKIARGGLVPNDASGSNKNIWENVSGGAEFDAGKASRSQDQLFIPSESTVTGRCNNDVGFYQISDQPPTMDCSDQGQWINLRNACSSLGCAEIVNGDNVHGNASWSETQLSGSAISVTATSCSTNFFPNPYASGYTNENPVMPTRQCQMISVNGSPQSGWGEVSNSCTNTCPGASTDSVNGKTNIPVSTDVSSTNSASINWSATNPGSYAYYAPSNCTSASQFDPASNSNCYQVRRFCGNGAVYNGSFLPKGKWADPEPMCIANGQVGKATYSQSTPVGTPNAVVVNSNVLQGTCVSGHVNTTSGAPQRQCQYQSGNIFFDRVSLNLTNGRQDCVQTCAIAANENLSGLTVNTSTAGTYIQGQQINLACQPNKIFVSGTMKATCNSGSWGVDGVCRDQNTCSSFPGTVTLSRCCHGSSHNCLSGSKDNKTFTFNELTSGAETCYTKSCGVGHLYKECVTVTKVCNDGDPSTQINRRSAH